METKYWAKAFWTTMFSVALGFPLKPDLQDMHHYKRYYHEIQYVLPCECKKSYRQKLRILPINPFLREGRDSLFTWVLNIYNMVNKDLNKPQVSRIQVLESLFPGMPDPQTGMVPKNQSGGGQLNSNSNSNSNIIGLGVLLAGAYYVFNKTK